MKELEATISIQDLSNFVDIVVRESDRVDKEIANLLEAKDEGGQFTYSEEQLTYAKENAKYWTECMNMAMRISREVNIKNRAPNRFTEFTEDDKISRSKDVPKSVKIAVQSKDPAAVRSAILAFADSRSDIDNTDTYFSAHGKNEENPASVLFQMVSYAERHGVDPYEEHKNSNGMIYTDPKDWDYYVYTMLYKEMHSNFSKERLNLLLRVNAYLTYNFDKSNNRK